jgi:hypothetical protein
MMGKNGFIRSMNSICVEGSLKMVISIGKSGNEGTITIPEAIASCTQVPCVKNGLVQYEHIKDGDYAILIRQPCLWPGGVQAVKVCVDPQIISTSGQTSWNTNWSMRIPPFAKPTDGLKYGEHQLEDIWRWVCWSQVYGHYSCTIHNIEKSKKPALP